MPNEERSNSLASGIGRRRRKFSLRKINPTRRKRSLPIFVACPTTWRTKPFPRSGIGYSSHDRWMQPGSTIDGSTEFFHRADSIIVVGQLAVTHSWQPANPANVPRYSNCPIAMTRPYRETNVPKGRGFFFHAVSRPFSTSRPNLTILARVPGGE